MRVFWDININEKTAELKNEDILLKFIYDLELMGDGTFIIKKIATLEGISIIGHTTKEALGCNLITRDGQEFQLKAQGWNALHKND